MVKMSRKCSTLLHNGWFESVTMDTGQRQAVCSMSWRDPRERLADVIAITRTLDLREGYWQSTYW